MGAQEICIRIYVGCEGKGGVILCVAVPSCLFGGGA